MRNAADEAVELEPVDLNLGVDAALVQPAGQSLAGGRAAI